MKDRVEALARAAGLELSEERLDAVGEALEVLLSQAERLRELPLEGVEPAPPVPDWE